jgi:hypothetical protein
MWRLMIAKDETIDRENSAGTIIFGGSKGSSFEIQACSCHTYTEGDKSLRDVAGSWTVDSSSGEIRPSSNGYMVRRLMMVAENPGRGAGVLAAAALLGAASIVVAAPAQASTYQSGVKNCPTQMYGYLRVEYYGQVQGYAPGSDSQFKSNPLPEGQTSGITIKGPRGGGLWGVETTEYPWSNIISYSAFCG